MGKALNAVAVLKENAGSLCKVSAQIMGCTCLKGSAILHHRLDRERLNSAGEPLPRRFLAHSHWNTQHVLAERTVHLQYGHSLLTGLRLCLMRCVSFLPKKFARAQEQPGSQLPAHNISPLIQL